MNSVVILPSEVHDSKLVVLEGARAAEFKSDHALPLGSKVSASILGGLRGEVEVVEIEKSRVVLRGDFSKPAMAREKIILIVAIPRPQTIRKVLQLGASVGIKSIYFVQSSSTQKSYLQSKMLLPDNIDYHLRLGQQQAFDSIAPEVIIYPSLRRLLDANTNQFSSADKFYAHTPRYSSGDNSHDKLCCEYLNPESNSIIAIGPESGWSEQETSTFSNEGFRRISLGERIYRVEVALAIVIGQIQALKALKQ